MRNLFFGCFLIVYSVIFSQDIIYKIDGEQITSKVEEIDDVEISYRKYDNLDGPIYIVAREQVSKIEFENGTFELFETTNVQNDLSIEEIKSTIIEYVDKYAFNKGGIHSYKASFIEGYLKLSLEKNTKGELFKRFTLYDFAGECTFHDLSSRNKGISYINVYVVPVFQKRDASFRVKLKTKLVIQVKGHDNAKTLIEALKNYNDFFKQ